MEFTELDQRRAALNISQYALCQRANVHPTTYYRLRQAPDRGQRRTLGKLRRALEAMVVERQRNGEAA